MTSAVRTLVHGPFRTRTYLVDCGAGEALIIDPTENPDGCIALATEAGLRIAAIAATHSHFDHVGAVAALRETLGVPFLIGAGALTALRAEADRMRATEHAIADPGEPDRLLVEGDAVEVGALVFQVIDTPGHSPGDISLYEPSLKAVFVGDTLHRGEIGRYNKGCDENLLRRSIQARLMVLPDETTVYSGHGRKTTIGRERHDNRGLEGLPKYPPRS